MGRMEANMANDDSMAFYTIDDVAIALRISMLSVMKYIKNGRLKSFKIGRLVRIRKTDFEDFLKTQNV